MSGSQLLIMALAMGLMYWLGRGMIWSLFGFFFFCSPITIGFVAGLIFGDVKQGLILGGGIAAVFAGVIAPGGNLPTDSAMAACTVIPVALATGLSVDAAVALAVPMGILGSFVTQLRKAINVIWVHMADNAAARGDGRGVALWGNWIPMIAQIFILGLPVFLAVYFGQDVMIAFMDNVPGWLMHGLEVAGGLMPAIGFALIMNMIGKPYLIPFTILGFIMVKILGLNSMAAGIVAMCIAVLVVYSSKKMVKGGAE